MDFAKLAEMRIEAAMESGAFENLPGAGKPLPPIVGKDFMEDFYGRMLKEAGAVPPEVSLKKKILADAKALVEMPDGEEKDRALASLSYNRMRLAMMMGK